MAAAGLVVCGAVATAGTIAEASPRKRVTICHMTGDPANPYVMLKVRTRYADGPSKSGKGDEKDYYINFKGALAPGSAGKWGDIIPPIKKKHSGLNWSTEGQAIWDNGCKLASAPPTTTTVPSTTTTSTSITPSTTSTSITPSTTSTSITPSTTSTSISEPPSTTTTAMIW